MFWFLKPSVSWHFDYLHLECLAALSAGVLSAAKHWFPRQQEFCCEYTDIFSFSPLLFIVSITFLISFQSYYLNHAIQKLRIYSYIFPIKNAFYLMIGTLGTCSEPTEPCSDILGNFLLRQVASKVLCSA